MNCNNGYNFKRANYPLLYESLSSIDWAPLQNIDDVEKACFHFYNKLYEVFNLAIPKYSSSKHREYYPPWFTSEIIRCVRQKTLAYKNYKKYRTIQYEELFKLHRSRSKYLIEEAYKRYCYGSKIRGCLDNSESGASFAGKTASTNLTEGKTEDWKSVFDLNVIALRIATREAVKIMKENKISGHIVHVNSVLEHQVFVGPGLVESELSTLNPNQTPERRTAMEQMPILKSEDIADGIVYALSTPEHVQIHELTIKPLGEKV
ncbi:hypothetical protein Zmor_003819 [Zophobas morio]|uniref:Dehydrogenase/reductase SDR family member 11 n=1 Tax=Zophobas morio TaxID=2755281 RepID=A0AA38HP66_9CUCU|nr:hypothetical protein Zmor_003819 [Zophobas morio]